jgi:hypothetical protein
MLSTVGRLNASPTAQAGVRAAAPAKAAQTLDSAKQAYKSLVAAERMRLPSSRLSESQGREAINEMVSAGLLSSGVGFGGAAKAGLVVRLLTGLGLSRGVAKKSIEMLADPDNVDKVLALWRKKGIDVRALSGALMGVGIGTSE